LRKRWTARREFIIGSNRKRGLIDRMAEHGHDAKLAKAMLQAMQTTLDRMCEHREMIERAIAAGRK
jgi:hypothetical protein